MRGHKNPRDADNTLGIWNDDTYIGNMLGNLKITTATSKLNILGEFYVQFYVQF